MIIIGAFGLFGFLLALAFFINGLGANPASAIQQQVQYLSWVISASGWIIFALAGVMYRLEQILRELRRLNPGTEGATEGSSDSR